MCLLPSIIIFGVEHRDPNWMPYPTLNWASWSYGVAILATFLSLFVMLAFEFTWRESKRTLETAGYEFPMSAVLRKREKKAIIEEQAKQATAAALEPVQRQVEMTTHRPMDDEKPSMLNEQSDSPAYRRYHDPRLGGASFAD